MANWRTIIFSTLRGPISCAASDHGKKRPAVIRAPLRWSRMTASAGIWSAACRKFSRGKTKTLKRSSNQKQKITAGDTESQSLHGEIAKREKQNQPLNKT